MWQKTFTKIYQNIQKESIWKAWADVNRWPKWDTALDYCEITGDFREGSQFILKPKGGPKVLLTLSEVTPYRSFTDYCKFFGAVMHDAHTLQETPEGIKITNTITVTGPLAFLWSRLVAKNVAKGVPEQTDRLVEYARKTYE